MKKIFLLGLAAILALSSAVYAGDNIVLPSPKRDGGISALAAISGRSSAKHQSFEKKELSDEQLATILWAAMGKNRPDKGWTVPLAQGMRPYVDIYVLLKKGSYAYDWEKGILSLIAKKDIISRSAGQEFVATAPCVLVFVASPNLSVASWADVASGAMSQNVYFAAEALGLKTRYMQSANRASLSNYLNLGPLNRIICIMPVGYQK